MKYLNRIATALCSVALGVMALTSCEGGDLYGVGSPDWIQNKIDSIEANKPSGDVELPAGTEDVYTIGKTDFSSGWWADFSKYYVIPDKARWDAVFNLNINPNATNTYKNFALIVTNDVDRGGDGYTEYGAIRFDHQPSGNSEWGDAYFQAHRGDVTSTLTFNTDTDPGVEKLGGRVILSIDRTDPNAFVVNITNGVVTKTMNIKEALPNLNADSSNTNIRAFLVVEGSFINFMQSNIEPIGGFTSADDKLPLSMKVDGMPDEVLIGTSLDDALASISATVNFEEGVTKVVPAAELYVTTDDDMNTVGEKTVVVIYNKTFKGVNCDKPLAVVAKFKVVSELSAFTQKYVCPNPAILGAEDNSSPFWGAHTDNVKIEPRQTVVSTFTNYTTSANNWNNFCIVLCAADNSEYAVVRADNFGWGAGYDGNPNLVREGTQGDWAEWLAAMDGAKVTTYVTNNGNGTANIKAVMVGNNNVEYVQTYENIKVNKDDLYTRFTVDGCHLVFDTEVGTPDCTTPFWGAHSSNIKVEAHTAASMSFTNYTCGAANWNNFCVVLVKADNSEYAVVRADNFGWGAGYDGNPNLVHEGTQGDWAEWLSAMNGANVDLTVTNNGNGTADIALVMHGNNGVDYYQNYNGINTVDPSNFYYRLTVDNSYVQFSPGVTQAKPNFVQVSRKSVRRR